MNIMFTESTYLGSIIRDSILNEIKDIRTLKFRQDLVIEIKVHETRKAIKRMRSLLRLLKHSYLPRNYYMLDGVLEKAARKLSAMRDAAVNLETFQDLIARHPGVLSGSLSAQLIHGLSERTVKAYRDHEGELDSPLYLDQVMHFLQHTPFEELSYESLLNRLDRSWIKAMDAYKNAAYTLDTEIIHTWRRYSKYLYLQLKFAPALQDLELRSLHRQLHKLTNTLGAEHDLALLEEVLNLNFDLSPAERQQIHGLISKDRSRYQKRAFSLGENLFSPQSIPSSRSTVTV